MASNEQFPFFDYDAARYAEFGYSKLVVGCAMLGAIVGMMQTEMSPQSSFWLSTFGAAGFFAVLWAAMLWIQEGRPLELRHVKVLKAMPWNVSAVAKLQSFEDAGVLLLQRHVRYVAMAHQKQVEDEGRNTYAIESTVLGRDFFVRYP